MRRRSYLALQQAAQGHPIKWLSVPIFTGQPTTRRGLTEGRIHLDAVTEDMVEFFGYGHAWLLAGAMHTVSGWPVVLVIAQAGYHLGVLTPGGDFLDVQGVRTLNEVRQDYRPDVNIIIEPTVGDLETADAILPWTWREDGNPAFFAEAMEFLAERLVNTALGQDDLGWVI